MYPNYNPYTGVLEDTQDIQGTYHRWSETGVDCETLKHNCRKCSIFLVFGRHKEGDWGKKCHQPEANQQLKDREIPMPTQSEVINKDAYNKTTLRKKWS